VEDTVVPEDFSAKVMAAVAATPQATPVAPAAAKKKTPWAKVLMPMAACCAIVVLLQSNPFRHLNAAREESAADMPMAAAVTEEGPAEEAAPEAKMELFADARIAEEPAAEAAMDTTSYAAATPTQSFSYAPYCIRITVDADYIGDLLDNYQSEVSLEINGVSEMHYELTLVQYEDLLSALSDRNELPAEEVFKTDSETVLVIVRQN
jgi:hypothetical protein